MNCPVCAHDDIHSTVRVLNAEVTLTAYPYFFDSEGRGHMHDGNKTTMVCVCSEDHRYIYEQYKSCWCGWSGGTDRVTNVATTGAAA